MTKKEIKASFRELTRDLVTGDYIISFTVPKNHRQACEDIANNRGIDLRLIISKYFKKRSLNANAYMWELLDNLSEALNVSSEKIYQRLVRDVPGNRFICPIETERVEEFKSVWASKGLGWFCHELRDSKHEGYTVMMGYYGSSEYDTKKMSRLIDLVVQECQQAGIETATPEQLERMKLEWDKKDEKGEGNGHQPDSKEKSMGA